MATICLHNGIILAGYAQMEACAVLIEDGLIADVFLERRLQSKKLPQNTQFYNLEGAFIAPGLIDTHIHGFNGAGTEDRSVEAMLNMSRDLANYGVTAFCPTIYPMDPDDMADSIRACVDAMGREQGARIMGVHLEGPFVSQAMLGVQRPEYIRAVDMDLMERLYTAGRGQIRNMTVAPEIKGMHELALYCIKRGIVLQAGHTAAKYENMLEGMQAGILHSTHMFNAMSSLHHRNPNAVGAILIHPELSCELIADGKHVHPDLIKFLLHNKPRNKVVLVTDSLKPTEQQQCPLYANGEEVVLRDGLFYRVKDDVIAGSASTLIKCLENLSEWGIAVEDAIEMAASNPARILQLGKRGLLVPGYEADLVVFDKKFKILASVIAGKFVKKEI